MKKRSGRALQFLPILLVVGTVVW
ncbi:MAG: hypothetical protein RL026_2074, partial [Pseudomonadota bacterium]